MNESLLKTKIRFGVFETNSSSTHSISIAKGEYIPDTLLVQDGVCEIRTGEFGWEVNRYWDATTKASYCLTWLKAMKSSYKVDVKKYEKMFVEVIKQVTGAREVRFVPEFEEKIKGTWQGWQWGYIDHQSLDDGGGGVLLSAWKSKKSLERFIFNSASELVTDNDNH